MNEGILGITSRATGANPARPLASTAQALAGTDAGSVVSPQAMHLSRRGSGRAWFWEAFTDFAFDFSGNVTGSDGFIFANGSSGTNAGAEIYTNVSSSFTTRPTAGILTITTGTTNTGRGGVYSWQTRPVTPLNGPIYVETLCSLPTLATVAEDYVARVGAAREQAPGASFYPGLCFEYDRSASANWQALFVNQLGSTQPRVDLGVPVTAGSWYKLGIVYTTTSATFFVNDVQCGSLPTGSLANTGCWFGGHIIKTAGTTARTFLWDWFYIRQDFSTPRIGS